LCWEFYSALVGRFLAGFPIGFAAVVCPLYIGEMAPMKYRGRISGFFSISIGIASIISAVFGHFLYIYKVKSFWRIMFAVGAIPCLILTIISCFIPESIKWMKEQKTKKTKRMKPVGDIEESTGLITKEIKPKATGCLGIIRNGKSVLIIALLLASINQVTTPISYYGPLALGAIGVDSPTIINIGLQTWFALCTLINISDWTGRKPLYLITLFITSASLFCIGLANKYLLNQPRGQYIIIVLYAFFILGYSPGPGNLFWVYVSEMFPQEYREVGLTVITVWATAFSTVIGFSFPWMSNQLGSVSTYWIYSGVCLSAFAYFVPNLKETKKNET